jgi:hypothetical protein
MPISEAPVIQVSEESACAQVCLDEDLFDEEVAGRLDESVYVYARTHCDGDDRRLALAVARRGFPVWQDAMTFVASDCGGIAAASAAKIEAALVALCPECLAPPARPVLAELTVPLSLSPSVTAPWEGRAGVGVSALVNTRPCCFVAGVVGEISSPISLGDDAWAQIADATTRLGWSVALPAGGAFGGSWDARLAGGLGVGVASAWGVRLAENRTDVAPAALAWLQVGATRPDRMKLAVGVRANLLRVELVTNGGQSAADGSVAEPWVRAEFVLSPVIGGQRRTAQ